MATPSKQTALNRQDMIRILNLKSHDAIQAVFREAREHRERQFGNQVFLYGFMYISTYCRNNCQFCFYRISNSEAIRYRKSMDQILESCQRLADSGVHLIDLSMGEDPEIFHRGQEGFDSLLHTIKAIKAKTGLPVMVSAGVIPEETLKTLKDAGAAWYACYQETHNRTLYHKLRSGQDYDHRFESKRRAKKMGYLIEEGLLTGIGETSEDIVDSILTMRDINADQVRVMTFVPQKGTPMANNTPPDDAREFLIIALMRLMFPDALIPASLDIGGLAGLEKRLAAGANVVTSLVPPGQGLAGVVQNSLDIEDGKRTVAGIQKVLSECGLTSAPSKAYPIWINNHMAARQTTREEGAPEC